MTSRTPHLVQYQGSKRLLAPQILSVIDGHYGRLVEPFSGTAAISIAAAIEGVADSYWINDINEPLVEMLRECVEHPQQLADDYESIWLRQFDSEAVTPVDYFYQMRSVFNDGNKSPAMMLFLLARVVKGAVRYDKYGNLNQSPDKRRNGTRPRTIRKNAFEISFLLKGKATFTSIDYTEVFEKVTANDSVYLDPPYQGVSFTKDHRYYAGLDVDAFAESLSVLNEKGVDFIVSYDGLCGEKIYGTDLPECLECKKILLNAGRSAQATMLGRKDVTYESLYLSRRLRDSLDSSRLTEVNGGLLLTS